MGDEHLLGGTVISGSLVITQLLFFEWGIGSSGVGAQPVLQGPRSHVPGSRSLLTADMLGVAGAAPATAGDALVVGVASLAVVNVAASVVRANPAALGLEIVISVAVSRMAVLVATARVAVVLLVIMNRGAVPVILVLVVLVAGGGVLRGELSRRPVRLAVGVAVVFAVDAGE